MTALEILLREANKTPQDLLEVWYIIDKIVVVQRYSPRLWEKLHHILYSGLLEYITEEDHLKVLECLQDYDNTLHNTNRASY